LVVARKRARRLRLPEDACARSDKVVVKQALVEAPRVALPVYRLEALSAPLDAGESVAGSALV